MGLSFRKRSEMPVDAKSLYDWHERPGAFRTAIRPVQMPTGLNDGDRAVFQVKLGPLWTTWVAEHRDVIPGKQFRDVQVKGPFKSWSHLHRFDERDEHTSVLDDAIEYAPPGGSPAQALLRRFFHKDLTRMFAHRHRTTREDLRFHTRLALAPQRVLISGASGLIGSNLSALLTTGGHHVRPLVRGSGDGVAWDPATGALDLPDDDAIDCLFHLAGAPVAAGRWTRKRKDLIRDSRVGPTRALCETLARRASPPRTIVIASAIGYYGDRGDEMLDERSEPGAGFLASVCRAWEDAAAPARKAGIRVVHLRIGIVLHPQGGALQKLLTPFRLGAGGRVGSGRQWWSWISLDDALCAAVHAMAREDVRGAVNVVAPNPCTNATFTSALGRALRRPTVAPLPAFAAKGMLGREMADEILLGSQRVVPRQLIRSGYRFRDPELPTTLPRLIGV